MIFIEERTVTDIMLLCSIVRHWMRNESMPNRVIAEFGHLHNACHYSGHYETQSLSQQEIEQKKCATPNYA